MDFENTVRKEIQNMINETLQEIIFDGTIYRFGKNKHAWYVAHEYIFKEKKYFTLPKKHHKVVDNNRWFHVVFEHRVCTTCSEEEDRCKG